MPAELGSEVYIRLRADRGLAKGDMVVHRSHLAYLVLEVGSRQRDDHQRLLVRVVDPRSIQLLDGARRLDLLRDS